jgi:hypothetical protein
VKISSKNKGNFIIFFQKTEENHCQQTYATRIVRGCSADGRNMIQTENGIYKKKKNTTEMLKMKVTYFFLIALKDNCLKQGFSKAFV